jgi:flagellar hook-associated protein 2
VPGINSLGSSSGLPLKTLLEDMAALHKQRLIPLNNQKKTYTEQLSAYSVLKSALWKLESYTARLRKSALFQVTKVTSYNAAFNATVTGTPSPGSWQLSVQNLASAQSLRTSTGQTDGTSLLGTSGAGSRTLTITQPGKAQPLTVTLSDSQTSLNAIRDAINNKLGSINAAVVSDEHGQYYLTLTAKDTGIAYAMEVNVSAEDPQLQALLTWSSLSASGNMTEAVPAKDAAFTFNGISMSRPGNTITDIPTGVTLTLKSESLPGTAEQLKIQSDTSAARQALDGFVTTYNELQNTIAHLTRYDPSGIKNGELFGEGTVRNIQIRLRSLLTGTQGGLKWLSNLGISFDETGHLTTDYYKMGNALSEQINDVISLLAGNNINTGLATEMDNFLYQANGHSGSIKAITDGIRGRIRTVDNQIAHTTAMSAQELAVLHAQLAKLDKTVTDLNRTSEYLEQQFKIINGTRG